MRILVVECDPDVARSTAELLASMGHDPSTARDAAEARRRAAGVDVVLLDRHAAGSELRSLAKDLGAPVVLLTTNPGLADVTPPRAIAAVVEKPFRLAELEVAIIKAAGRRGAVRQDASTREMASG